MMGDFTVFSPTKTDPPPGNGIAIVEDEFGSITLFSNEFVGKLDVLVAPSKPLASLAPLELVAPMA